MTSQYAHLIQELPSGMFAVTKWDSNNAEYQTTDGREPGSSFKFFKSLNAIDACGRRYSTRQKALARARRLYKAEVEFEIARRISD